MTERDFHAKYRLVVRGADGELQVLEQRHFDVFTASERATLFRLLGKIIASQHGMRLVQRGAITEAKES
jgi:hypothetical protein